MNAPARFMVLVVGSVVMAAFIMAPRRDELIATMVDNGQNAEVISLLEPELARRENDPTLLATLVRSYTAIGKHQRAAELLERYCALRSDDADAYARLADLYKTTGDVPQRISALERYLAIAPKLSRALELADLYRRDDRASDERALLMKFEPDLTVEDGLNERERILLAELLVDTGRSADAVRLAKKWILQWREPWLAGRILHAIARSASAADATELGDAVLALHPDLRLYLVHDLTTIGAGPVARHILETWPKANPSLSMNEIAAFLSACRELGEPAIAWQAFGDVLGHPHSDDAIIRYSEAVAAEFGVGALAPFWTSIPKTVLARRPLLTARLAFHEQDLATARRLLDQVDLAALEPSDRRLWIDMLIAVTSESEAFAKLYARRRDGHLPSDLLAQYARLAGGLGQEKEYQAALADLRRKFR